MADNGNGKYGFYISVRTLGWLLAFVSVVATATTAYAFLRADVNYVITDRAKNGARYASKESLNTIDSKLVEIMRRLECIDKKLDERK